MNPPQVVLFRTGERYENRRGVFEVLSIDEDSMRIRWDTGEEINTSAALQAKILANMDREFAEATVQKRGKTPKSFGEFFRGLQAQDFVEDVTGTHWRSREQLGGAVTKLLDVPEPYNSWSIYGRPEVHWASVSRYRLHHPSVQAKFLAHVNAEEVLFGLYLERSNQTSDNQDDWLKFVAWVSKAQNATWLHETLFRSGSVITNPYNNWPDLAFYGTISPTSAGYSWNRAAKPESAFRPDQLGQILGELPAEHWLNIVLGQTMSKDTAVGEGARIAATMAEWFNILMPVYDSTAPVI